MSDHPKVAIFWDYENCNPPSSSCGLGYSIVNNISRIARVFGSVTAFRAYLDISAQSSKSVVFRSELQSSGVSMIDCPHNGKKDVVDKMILVDMLAFAIDHPTPATIILITGDRDYAYAVSTLKLRKYQIILVVPSSPHASPSLESQASLVIDWTAAALKTRADAVNSTQAVRQPYLELDANLVTKLLRELQEPPLNDLDSTAYPYSTASHNTPMLRRITTHDLLEPLRHCKNTGCFDFTQEFASAPTASRKSMSTGSEPTLTGPIPSTPSHSRRASISTGSIRARSTTIIAQSPLAVEQDISGKNPSPSCARRSSVSDIMDAPGSAKRSPSVLPSLDTLELSLHDSRPPSSIIVRSPLESSQSIPVSGKLILPSSHGLNYLASPFVMTKTPTGLKPTSSSYTKQSHTMTRPTSPIMAPTKTLSATATSLCETSQIEDSGVPKELEHLRIGNDDTDSEWSIPYPINSNESTCDATDTPKSNYHSHVTPHITYSLSSGNIGLHPTDTPASKHVSPPATFPSGVGDGIESQFAAFSCASNTAPGSESVLSPGAFPSTPFTTTESHEENRRPETWTMFQPLIHLLLAARERGIVRPSRSTIAVELVQSDKQVYQRAGASKFRDYTALAERAGIIELGGREGGAWIGLHHNWFGLDGDGTTRFLSNSVSSPKSDPTESIQNPLSTGPKTPLIERTQTPTFISSILSSPEVSNTLPTSPTDRQNSAAQTFIPTQFQPLIDILIHLRAEGFHQTLRSLVGQQLGQNVYARAGVSGFKEYIHQASEAQLVQCGGVGGHAWIRLHPELRI